MSTVDDLITLIDLANESAAFIGPTNTIADIHDMAHVLTGGDRMRSWEYIAGNLGGRGWSGMHSPAWPDVQRRGQALYRRMTAEEAP